MDCQQGRLPIRDQTGARSHVRGVRSGDKGVEWDCSRAHGEGKAAYKQILFPFLTIIQYRDANEMSEQQDGKWNVNNSVLICMRRVKAKFSGATPSTRLRRQPEKRFNQRRERKINWDIRDLLSIQFCAPWWIWWNGWFSQVFKTLRDYNWLINYTYESS